VKFGGSLPGVQRDSRVEVLGRANTLPDAGIAALDAGARLVLEL